MNSCKKAKSTFAVAVPAGASDPEPSALVPAEDEFAHDFEDEGKTAQESSDNESSSDSEEKPGRSSSILVASCEICGASSKDSE